MKRADHIIQTLTQKIVAVPKWWYITAVLVVATTVRLLSIVKASIWHDEGYTMMLITRPFFDIAGITANDVHPPLYYLVAHLWQSVFGMSELAVRSLSLVFGVALVFFVYLLVKRLWNREGLARLAMLFTALGPFLIRYSEEARMYSMAAFLVVLAAYLLVVALQKTRRNTKYAVYWWFGHGVALALALYTHYFTALIIPVFIGYAIAVQGSVGTLIRTKGWWLGNGLGALLFLPWLPAAIGQFTRVQSGFWIPPVGPDTLTNTLFQFFIFDGNKVVPGIEILVLLAFTVLCTLLYVRSKYKKQTGFILAWLVVPIILAMLVSLKQPVYYDRYFVYCAVAFSIILALFVVYLIKRPTWQFVAAAVVIGIFTYGLSPINTQANHQMRAVGATVSDAYQPGDYLVSGELYTYFDFSYYNKTGAELHLLSAEPVSGYGETSLIIDRQDTIVVPSLEAIPESAQRIWVIGKTGEHDYFSNVPANWQLVTSVEAGDSAARLYTTGE